MTIGQIRTPDVTERPNQIQANPRAFGAGIVNALDGLSQAIDFNQRSQQDIIDAQNAHNNQLDMYSAQRDFITWQTQVDKDYLDAQHAAPVFPRGFTNSVYEKSLKTGDEFLTQLPQHLRNQFSVKVKQVQQDLSLHAYKFEYQQSTDAMRKDIANNVQDGVNRIIGSSQAFDPTKQATSDLIDNSALPAPEKQILHENINDKYTIALFNSILREGEVNKGAVRPANQNDVVAAGISGIFRGLLNGIAGKESGGAYNVMFGGEHFSDFSHHPNIAHPITSGPNKGKTSTAAGRYQFLYSTWLEAKSALGLRDFSPESQDRAAIWLAKRDYKLHTGNDLETVLVSGNSGNIASILSNTWEGLKGENEKYLMEAVSKGQQSGPTGSIGTPDPFTDKRFSNLSYDVKVTLEHQANMQNAARQTQELRQLQTEQITQTNTINDEIITGKAGKNDIYSAYIAGKITFQQRQTLVKVYDKHHANEVNANIATQTLRDGGIPTDKNINSFLLTNGDITKMNAGNTDVIGNTLIPLVRDYHVLPSIAVKTLLSLRHNPKTEIYAYDALSAIRGTNSDLLNAQLTPTQKKELNYYRVAKGELSSNPTQAIALMDRYNDPNTIGQRQQWQNTAEKAAQDITPTSVTEKMSNWYFSSPAVPLGGQVNRMTADYKNLFVEGMVRFFGNTDKADEYVKEGFKNIWSVTNIGGTSRFMRFNPARFSNTVTTQEQKLTNGSIIPVGTRIYPSVNGNLDWVDAQIRDEYSWGPNVQFELVADNQTSAEAGQGKIPTYTITYVNKQGKTEIMLDKEGIPTRYGGYLPDNTVQAMANRVKGLSELRGAFFGFSTSNSLPDILNKIADASQQIKKGIRPNAAAEDLATKNRAASNKIVIDEYTKAFEAAGVKAFDKNGRTKLPTYDDIITEIPPNIMKRYQDAINPRGNK